MTIPLTSELSFRYARVERLSPLIRRVMARNPGPFTLHGTASYIVGSGRVAVIDPGPLLDEHVDALWQGLRAAGETVSHIVLTHTHRDHSPASRPLAALSGAPILGYGPHGSGRRPTAGADHQAADDAVEEGGDSDCQPDQLLRHGDVIAGDDWTLEAVYTPGHTSNHLCFQLREEQLLFSGDHVMGWSTSVIAPPDGHMGDYLDSLQLLLTRDDRRYLPTHGPRIDQPKTLVRAFVRHRQLRLRQLLDALATGPSRIDSLLDAFYPQLDQRLRAAAARSVLASLIYLCERGQVAYRSPVPGLTDSYYLCADYESALLALGIKDATS